MQRLYYLCQEIKQEMIVKKLLIYKILIHDIDQQINYLFSIKLRGRKNGNMIIKRKNSDVIRNYRSVPYIHWMTEELK